LVSKQRWRRVGSAESIPLTAQRGKWVGKIMRKKLMLTHLFQGRRPTKREKLIAHANTNELLILSWGGHKTEKDAYHQRESECAGCLGNLSVKSLYMVMGERAWKRVAQSTIL